MRPLYESTLCDIGVKHPDICFGCLKERCHLSTHNMFWMRIKKDFFYFAL